MNNLEGVHLIWYRIFVITYPYELVGAGAWTWQIGDMPWVLTFEQLEVGEEGGQVFAMYGVKLSPKLVHYM